MYEAIENDREKKQVYRLAKEREEEEKEIVVAQGIKEKDGQVVASQVKVIGIWKSNFQGLSNLNKETK